MTDIASMADFSPITKHRVYLFCPFAFKAENAVTAIQNALALKPEDYSYIMPQGNPNSVWEIKEKYSVSWDLHKQVATILGLKPFSHKNKKLFTGHRPLTANEEIIDIFNNKKQGLSLKLSETAQVRLSKNLGDKQALSIRVFIEEITVHFFASGIGLAAILVNYKAETEKEMRNLYPLELLEANYAITHNYPIGKNDKKRSGNLYWHNISENSKDTLFHLRNVLMHMLPIQDLIPYSLNWNRVFCYTAVQLYNNFQDNQQRCDFAFRLSRRYHAGYGYREVGFENISFQPFENIMHMMALEGGALVIEEHMPNTGETTEFIKNFAYGPATQVYMPLALVAYHEFLWLLHLTQDSAMFLDFKNPNKEEKQALKEFSQHLLQFRLFYRFTHVSMISMHNAVHEKWRKVLNLEEMLEEVNADVTEAENYLDDLLAQQRDENFHWLSVLSAIILTFLAANTLATEAFYPLFGEENITTGQRLVTLGLEGIVALLAGWITHLQQRVK